MDGAERSPRCITFEAQEEKEGERKWKKALGQTKQPRQYKGRERARRNQSDTVTEPKLIKVGSQVPNNRASILAATQSDFCSPSQKLDGVPRNSVDWLKLQ